MNLEFIGIDPATDSDNCPAVFVDQESGDLVFQGWTVTDAQDLTAVAAHSPIGTGESVVRLIAAGEQVRWLPRRRCSDLCLPGNDFWVFDDRLVRFGHFAGDGGFLDHELTRDPAVVRQCATAFEAVWERAIDHAQYQLA